MNEHCKGCPKNNGCEIEACEHYDDREIRKAAEQDRTHDCFGFITPPRAVPNDIQIRDSLRTIRDRLNALLEADPVGTSNWLNSGGFITPAMKAAGIPSVNYQSGPIGALNYALGLDESGFCFRRVCEKESDTGCLRCLSVQVVNAAGDWLP